MSNILTSLEKCLIDLNNISQPSSDEHESELIIEIASTIKDPPLMLLLYKFAKKLHKAKKYCANNYRQFNLHETEFNEIYVDFLVTIRELSTLSSTEIILRFANLSKKYEHLMKLACDGKQYHKKTIISILSAVILAIVAIL